MWELVDYYFDKYPGQKRVAKYMMDNGLKVKDKQIHLDEIRISNSELARVVGVDKRVIYAAIKTINGEPKLFSIFSKLIPSCNLKDVAPEMGWGTLAITLSNPTYVGVLGKIATTIGEHNISIRQAIGEDPTFDTGLLYIVTESPIPGDLINAIKDIKGVESVTIN